MNVALMFVAWIPLMTRLGSKNRFHKLSAANISRFLFYYAKPSKATEDNNYIKNNNSNTYTQISTKNKNQEANKINI